MASFLEDSYGEPILYSKSEGLITGCAVCNRKDGLKRCSGCYAIFYCGRDHQLADRNQHKTFCNMIKKTNAVMRREENILRTNPGDGFFMAGNPFEHHVGHFWGIHDTRDYMRSRYSVVEALLKINTELAVKSALDHLLDMLRLCRSDNMGVRDAVPALYLRLDRDQECYDFLKWWGTTGNEGDYDWGNMDLPYLNVRNADIFEAVDGFTRKYALSLSHVVALTLLKIRLLIDLTNLDLTNREIKTSLPVEIVNMIRVRAVRSSFPNNLEILERDQTPHIRNLRQQIKSLYECVKRGNKFMWPAMLKPGHHLTARPNYSSSGDVSEAQLALQYNYNAWVETSGAIEIISQMSLKTGKRV